jgi:hypothetical protein
LLIISLIATVIGANRFRIRFEILRGDDGGDQADNQQAQCDPKFPQV